MNAYEQLIGQSFIRHGKRFTIVKCHGTTIVAAFLDNGRVSRMLVPLDDALKSLDITEVRMTDLPAEKTEAVR